eukprot:gene10547-biopygen6511
MPVSGDVVRRLCRLCAGVVVGGVVDVPVVVCDAVGGVVGFIAIVVAVVGVVVIAVVSLVGGVGLEGDLQPPQGLTQSRPAGDATLTRA